MPPGTGYTSGDLGCQWINGNLQSNTAYYAEGDATVQRVWLTDFPPGLHSVTLQYGTTKGGKHAYDFLTTWNWSENWITDADRCQDITGCLAASDNGLDIPQDPNVPNSFEPSAPGARQFTMRGGTLTSVTTPVIAGGSYAGDSETNITVSFNVPSSGPMCNANGCAVALWFGAHVSAQANWGLGQGAGSINGSPYHVALSLVDGASVGKRDNQMQSNVVSQIPNGTIVIVKDAVPNDAQDFSFNVNNGGTISQNFSLDDDGDATLPNSQTFSVPPGTWTAAELNIPSGWSLTNLACSVSGTNGSTYQVSGANAVITLLSGVSSGDTVTCTYTNTRNTGSLQILKTVSNPDNATLPASFTVDYNCGTGYTGQVSVAPGTPATVNDIPTGSTCTVTEVAPAVVPGYTWGTITYTPASVTISTGGGTFDITVGNSITRDRGSRVLAKSLSGGPAGYTGPFTINYDCDGTAYDGSVSVSAGGSQTVSGIPTGTSCTVSETLPNPPAGYSFGTPTFSPQATVVIPSGNGSSVTVTTNNTLTLDTGSLKILKTLSNPDGASVPASFTIDYSCDDGTSGNVSVAAGGSQTVSGIPTGSSCTVSEPALAPIPGYTWGTPVVTGSPATIGKDTTVEVTVANSITRDRGSLTIVKNVVNDNGGTATVSAFGLNTTAGSLTFDGGVANGTTTTYTSQKITVVTGAYTLKENDVYGYTEGAWSCTNGTANPTT